MSPRPENRPEAFNEARNVLRGSYGCEARAVAIATLHRLATGSDATAARARGLLGKLGLDGQGARRGGAGEGGAA